jgi:hypothetical protein
VLERMRNVQIRGTPIAVKLATPHDGRADHRSGDRPDHRGIDRAGRRGGPPPRGKGPSRPKKKHRKGGHAA